MTEKRISDFTEHPALEVEDLIEVSRYNAADDYTSMKIKPAAFSAPLAYDYVVILDTTYKAINGATRVIDYSGADLHTVLESALSGSRTVPLSVAIVGAVTLTADVEVPDYSDVYILGTVTSTASLDIVFANSDSAGGNTDIRFFGPGTIDAGITATSIYKQQPIYMENVTGVTVSGLTIKNSGTHCVSLLDCSQVRVSGNTISSSGDDGISVLSTDNFVITENIIFDTREDFAGVGSSGIEIEDGASHGVISNNYIYDCHRGIHCVVDTAAVFEVNYLTVTGNFIRNMSQSGVALTNNYSVGTKFINGCSVTGNVVDTVGGTGACFSFIRLRDCAITGNVAKDGSDDGFLFTNCQRTTVSGCAINTCTGRGFDVTACGDMSFSNIHVRNPGVSGTTREAFRGTTCTDLQVHGFVAIDDRSATEGMAQPMALNNCAGHLLVMGLQASGNNDSGTGTTGIAKQGTTGTVIGANTTDIDTTNLETGV